MDNERVCRDKRAGIDRGRQRALRGIGPASPLCGPRLGRVSVMRKNRAAGFTLVEIVVVMAIVALLMAIIVPIFSTSGKRISQQTCMNNLHALGVNLTQYWQDYGAYPAAPQPAYLRTLDPKYTPFGYLPTRVVISTDPATALDDLGIDGVYAGDNPMDYQITVNISASDNAPNPDEYRWSDNGGQSWEGPFPISDTDTAFGLRHGLQVQFANQYGHSTADAWTISLEPKLSPDWLQWQTPSPDDYPTIANAIPNDSTATPVSVDSTDFLWDNRAAAITSPDKAYRELFIVKEVNTDNNTFTTYRPVSDIFPAGSVIEPGYFEFTMDPADSNHPLDDTIDQHFVSGNFGLARFLEIYGLSKRQFHCPQVETTENVDTDANLRMSTEGSGFTRSLRFDTLLSGFNTYDVTYNYDQYDNDIRYFDARLGFNELNARRQLKEKYPPADTVVTWCYGHRPDQTPSFDPGAPDEPDLIDESFIARQEQNQRDKKVLILWVDGAVDAMSPYLARGADDAFYWVPPFLYSRGEWQK